MPFLNKATHTKSHEVMNISMGGGGGGGGGGGMIVNVGLD